MLFLRIQDKENIILDIKIYTEYSVYLEFKLRSLICDNVMVHNLCIVLKIDKRVLQIPLLIEPGKPDL